MQKVVFVVDDDGTNLTKAAEALEKHYRVVTISSALKMFSLLEKIIPEMIILDIEMPDMRGTVAIAKLKEKPEWANIPVIFLTAWGDEIIMKHCLDVGALDIINKPFSAAVLLNRVRNYMTWLTGPDDETDE